MKPVILSHKTFLRLLAAGGSAVGALDALAPDLSEKQRRVVEETAAQLRRAAEEAIEENEANEADLCA